MQMIGLAAPPLSMLMQLCRRHRPEADADHARGVGLPVRHRPDCGGLLGLTGCPGATLRRRFAVPFCWPFVYTEGWRVSNFRQDNRLAATSHLRGSGCRTGLPWQRGNCTRLAGLRRRQSRSAGSGCASAARRPLGLSRSRCFPVSSSSPLRSIWTRSTAPSGPTWNGSKPTSPTSSGTKRSRPCGR